MEPDTMGIVLVSARIENLYDVKNAEDGLIPADQVRRIEVNDARVEQRGNLCLDAHAADQPTGTQVAQDDPGQDRCEVLLLRHI